MSPSPARPSTAARDAVRELRRGSRRLGEPAVLADRHRVEREAEELGAEHDPVVRREHCRRRAGSWCCGERVNGGERALVRDLERGVVGLRRIARELLARQDALIRDHEVAPVEAGRDGRLSARRERRSLNVLERAGRPVDAEHGDGVGALVDREQEALVGAHRDLGVACQPAERLARDQLSPRPLCLELAHAERRHRAVGSVVHREHAVLLARPDVRHRVDPADGVRARSGRRGISRRVVVPAGGEPDHRSRGEQQDQHGEDRYAPIRLLLLGGGVRGRGEPRPGARLARRCAGRGRRNGRWRLLCRHPRRRRRRAHRGPRTAVELHGRVAELDLVARREDAFALDLLTVDEGAVPGSEVLDHGTLIGHADPGVASRELRVVAEVARRGLGTTEDQLVLDLDRVPGVVTPGHAQFHCGRQPNPLRDASPGQTWRQSSRTLPACPPAATSKASSNSAAGKRWVITGVMSSPDCSRTVIAYQLSYISRP